VGADRRARARAARDRSHARHHPTPPGGREAVIWSIFYIAVAIAFGLVFASIAGWGFGGEYFARYIVEKSLSVDNLFVFVVIMTTFAVPAEHQQKVLFVGIGLALVLRVVFIALGAALLAAFSFMFLLIGTAIQLFRHRDQEPTVDDNALVTFARKRLPLTDDYHGGNLLTRIEGRRMFTPLFLVLIAIGSTDLLFALDSIPAVFGVTDEAFIVFTANAFALLGLRLLLPGHRPRPARLPLHRSLGHPRLHRHQACPALGPPPRRPRSRDRHHHLARRDRRCAHRHDRRQRHQGPPRPQRQSPCRLAARPPRARSGTADGTMSVASDNKQPAAST
jgi:TerC family integral membrane protein